MLNVKHYTKVKRLGKMNEYSYEPVDFALWDVLKPHIKSDKLENVVLLHVFGENGNKAIFVTSDDKVYATGANLKFCLGLAYTTTPDELVELKGLSHQNVKCFSSGIDFTIALTKNGRLLSFGDNNYGQLGKGSSHSPNGVFSVGIPEKETIVSVQCGRYYSLALSSCNKIYEWGYRKEPGVGDQFLPPRVMPYFYSETICRISCCNNIYTALSENGDMYKWEETDGEILLVAKNVSAIGCSSDGFIYVRNGILYKNDEIIGYADDFVVQNNYLCFKKGKEFFFKVDTAPPIKIYIPNFQSAFGNHECPQFSRAKKKIISDRDFYKLFYNNKVLSDLTIKLSNGNMYAHKGILMSFCDHFKQMLTGPWAASNSTEIDMTMYNPLAYETFLKYVYSGNLYYDKLTGSDLIDLYSIAESYFEIALQQDVEIFFKDCLRAENVCQLYALAEKRMAVALVDACLNFACNKIASIVITQSYDNMKPETAKKFIKSSITRNV